MMMFGQTGAVGPSTAAQSLATRVSQASSSSAERALTVGNEPITPLRHAAETRSGPETRSIGAAISGSFSRARREGGRAIAVPWRVGEREIKAALKAREAGPDGCAGCLR